MPTQQEDEAREGSNGTDLPAKPVDVEPTYPELDLPKLEQLPADQRDIFLFVFVSELNNHVLGLSTDDCTAQQFYLKREIFQILNLTSCPPSRVIRTNIGRCLAHVFKHGNRKLLFETINDLISLISTIKSKSNADNRSKHAAICCLGDVFEAAGDSAIGLHQLACSTLIKSLKSASSHAGMRAAVFVALSKIINMIGNSTDEGIARDVWKQARSSTTGDKGSYVVMCALKCLKSLQKHTAYFCNAADFDKMEAAVLRAADSYHVPVRHAAAECLAEAYVCNHANQAESGTDGSVPKAISVKAKKPKRLSTHPEKPEDDHDEPSRHSTDSAGITKRSQRLSLTVQEVIKRLVDHYVKSATTNRARAAIGVCLGILLRRLGEMAVRANYLRIVEIFSIDLLGHSTISKNRYRLLISRRICDTIIQNVIGHKILGQAGEIAASELLINNVLKNYPQTLSERAEPTKETLILSLNAAAALIKSLGSAASTFSESCRDALVHILQHLNYSVQVAASHCLRTLVLACPQQILSCLSVCMNALTRELNMLGNGRNVSKRCQGFALGLAAALSASALRPLYGSLDIDSRVLTVATQLLKSSSQSELRIASAQVQVAWTLIGGLMSLGPNFVKIHLSQLLLLWKNALPKPLVRDNTSSRSVLECSFLTHVRGCALSSIRSFLQHNHRLLTMDVSKRIAAMLQSTIAFSKTLPEKKTTEDISQRLDPALQLHDLDIIIRRRTMQCYVQLINLSPIGSTESLLQSNLLTLAMSLFADPENYAPDSISASIAHSAATFESVWEVGDDRGFGVTGLVSGFSVIDSPGQNGATGKMEITHEGPNEVINSLLLRPVCGSLEHDASVLYIAGSEPNASFIPDPPATEVVNSAIHLFAFAFPLTPAKVQESVLEQIKTFTSAGILQRDPGRKAAINVNIATSILCSLKVALKETTSPPGNVSKLAVERLLQDLVRDVVLDPDPFVRSLGYAAVARLCNLFGNTFTNNEVKYLVDTIITNREPSARAGCAMALGSIQAKVGGMAAGYHLKTILGVLMSLCNDPHPTVHYWALKALALASDATGLSFASYVPSTLGMLAQLYVSETHHCELSSTITMNLEMDIHTVAAIGKCVDSLINVLGPDLQDSRKSRELIFSLVHQFQTDRESLVESVALRCMEHLSLYAPGQMRFSDYVKLLQRHLTSDDPSLRDIVIDGLHNVMKREPQDMLRDANEGIEEQFWLLLDHVPHHDGLQNILMNWLRHTCLDETRTWMQRLKSVLKMTRQTIAQDEIKSTTSKGVPDLQDEEVAGFAAVGGSAKEEDNTANSEAEPLRWQVTTFAMRCLSDLFHIITKDIAANGESAAHEALQEKIADVVRMAFFASTSNVLELRIWGLKIIGAVLKMFGKTPDPDFEEAMLLEQYQAQISSALTPAFAADSSPELASEAVNVCASFIATGIVTDADRMGQILRTLTNALEAFAEEKENAGIGDLKGLNSNAQTKVKVSVFSAWADIQVASTQQTYLTDVLKPHIGTLTPLWLSSLREFARLRFEPDISLTLGPTPLSGSLDTVYAAMNRETLLGFYQASWLKLVDAIACLIDQDSDFVFDALDGKPPHKDTPNRDSKGSAINYRDEPVAFFFVLFGLAFEALATRPGPGESLATPEQTLDILQALKKILCPGVCGHAIYRPDVFAEMMDLLDRLILTEGLGVQSVIIDIARTLCVNHPSARRHGRDEGDLSEDIDQLFELTRIIVLVLSGLLPNLSEGNHPARHQMNEEAIVLVRKSMDALVDASGVFPSIIKTDLHACVFHIFAIILATPSCQELVALQSFAIFKRFVAGLSETAGGDESTGLAQMQLCLQRFLSIYLHAQKREEPTSLTCVKNYLLALTILFTSGKNQLSASEALVSRYLEEVLDCLTDFKTARVAASCIRSLLMQSKPTSADRSIAHYIVPRLISFVIDTGPDDPENARSLIAHTLCLFVGTLQSDQRTAAMSLALPMLMARAVGEGVEVYDETRKRLLELAAIDQTSFKVVMNGMSESQRALLEEVIRSKASAMEGADEHSADTPEQPTITLKTNFGE